MLPLPTAFVVDLVTGALLVVAGAFVVTLGVVVATVSKKGIPVPPFEWYDHTPNAANAITISRTRDRFINVSKKLLILITM